MMIISSNKCYNVLNNPLQWSAPPLSGSQRPAKQTSEQTDVSAGEKWVEQMAAGRPRFSNSVHVFESTKRQWRCDIRL